MNFRQPIRAVQEQHVGLRGGLRLGYAPGDHAAWYADAEWLNQLQDSPEMTIAAGGEPRSLGFVAGSRLSF